MLWLLIIKYNKTFANIRHQQNNITFRSTQSTLEGTTCIVRIVSGHITTLLYRLLNFIDYFL